MKEKTILFSGPMVVAILEGRKSQTRRLVKPQGAHMFPMLDFDGTTRGDWFISYPDCEHVGKSGHYPPYHVGTRLWVRETLKKHAETRCWLYAADGKPVLVRRVEDMGAMAGWAHHKQHDHCVSIHMPRWASRIELEVTEVRAQRLQDITEEDAKAEGVHPKTHIDVCHSYRGGFASIIDEVNSTGTWASNAWIWAYTFRRTK